MGKKCKRDTIEQTTQKVPNSNKKQKPSIFLNKFETL